MQWFKKLFSGKSANRSKVTTVIAVGGIDGDLDTNRLKTMSTVTCAKLQNFTLANDNGRRECIENYVESTLIRAAGVAELPLAQVTKKRKASNAQRQHVQCVTVSTVADESTAKQRNEETAAATKTKPKQLTDKTTSSTTTTAATTATATATTKTAIANDDDDTDTCRSIDIEELSTDDGSTNVNVNGNGENDKALLQSKETRRTKYDRSISQQINLVANSSAVNGNEPSSISGTNNSYGDQSLAVKGNHQYLHQRVRELECFISTIGEAATATNTAWQTLANSEESTAANTQSTAESCTTSIATATASAVAAHHCSATGNEPQILIDWVIVSLECECVSVYEYHFDDENRCISAFEAASQQSPQSHGERDGTNDDDEDVDDDEKIVCNTSTVSNDYGWCRLQHRTYQLFLWFVKLFDSNIKTGTPCPSASSSPQSSTSATAAASSSTLPLSVNEATMKSTLSLILRRFISTDSLYSINEQRVEMNYLSQHDANCLHKMSSSKGSLDVLTSSTPLVHSLYASETNSVGSVVASAKSSASIPEYFGLNDYGDIIIHVDHVHEEKGFGFKMHRKKIASYRHTVVRGKEVTEKKFCFKSAMKRFFKEVVTTFNECCRGE